MFAGSFLVIAVLVVFASQGKVDSSSSLVASPSLNSSAPSLVSSATVSGLLSTAITTGAPVATSTTRTLPLTPTTTTGSLSPTLATASLPPTSATTTGSLPPTSTTTTGSLPPTSTTTTGSLPPIPTTGSLPPTPTTTTPKQKTCGYLSFVIKKKWDKSYLDNSSDVFKTFNLSLIGNITIMFKDTRKYSKVELSGMVLKDKDENIDMKVKLCVVVLKDDAESSIIDVVLTLNENGKIGNMEVGEGSVTFEELGVTLEEWEVKDEKECSKCSKGGGGPFVIKRNCESKTHSCNGIETKKTKKCVEYCDACSVAISSFSLVMGILLSFSFNIWK